MDELVEATPNCPRCLTPLVTEGTAKGSWWECTVCGYTALASTAPTRVWHLSTQRRTPPYLRPWRGDAAVPARIASAAALIRFAFRAETVTSEHRSRLVKDLLWDLTEADGKYRTRYRSEETRLLGVRPDWQSLLQHEHVVPRAQMRQRLLALEDLDSPALEALLGTAVGCVVTREEHMRLSRYDGIEDGWERYVAADVEVWDLASDPPTLHTLP